MSEPWEGDALAADDWKNLSAEELLIRYRASDLEAFRAFYSRTKGLVFSFLLSRLRNHADAEEALQDTYFRVHKYILTYDAGKPAIPWLMTIARNALINLVRKRMPLSAIDPDTIHSEPSAAAAVEIEDLLKKALSGLKAEDRKLLENKIFADLSYEELAVEAKISPANARQKVSRLLRKVKTSFSS